MTIAFHQIYGKCKILDRPVGNERFVYVELLSREGPCGFSKISVGRRALNNEPYVRPSFKPMQKNSSQ